MASFLLASEGEGFLLGLARAGEVRLGWPRYQARPTSLSYFLPLTQSGYVFGLCDNSTGLMTNLTFSFSDKSIIDPFYQV